MALRLTMVRSAPPAKEGPWGAVFLVWTRALDAAGSRHSCVKCNAGLPSAPRVLTCTASFTLRANTESLRRRYLLRRPVEVADDISQRSDREDFTAYEPVASWSSHG